MNKRLLVGLVAGVCASGAMAQLLGLGANVGAGVSATVPVQGVLNGAAGAVRGTADALQGGVAAGAGVAAGVAADADARANADVRTNVDAGANVDTRANVDARTDIDARTQAGGRARADAGTAANERPAPSRRVRKAKPAAADAGLDAAADARLRGNVTLPSVDAGAGVGARAEGALRAR